MNPARPSAPTAASLVIDEDDIRAAAQLLAGHVVRTPLAPAPRLAQHLGIGDLYLKLENLQFTGSFKDRGAFNKLSNLSRDEARTGVVAMSAGNHAQGVAYFAQKLQIPATIVMPRGTPFNKVERTRSYGATIALEGDGFDGAATHARSLADRHGYAFVHPYDDPLIIAGQGTIGLEILSDLEHLDILIVPIGGGGLIGGIATAVKTLRPSVQIIGVEAALYPSMLHAIKGERGDIGGQTIAEGIAIKAPGSLTKPLIEHYVDDIVLVSEESLERAVQNLAEIQKLVVEGAGAAGIAAMVQYPERFKDKKVATVICGGNIDSRMLAQVMMRGLVRDGRVATLRVEIIDQPGVLGKVARIIGDSGGNIIEIYHQRMFHDLPVKLADIDAVIETRNGEHVREIAANLVSAGFPVRILSSRSIEDAQR